VRRYLRDPTFSRFDTIPECDRHTHTHTHTPTHTDTRRRHIPRLARRRGKNYLRMYRMDLAQYSALVEVHILTSQTVGLLDGSFTNFYPT